MTAKVLPMRHRDPFGHCPACAATSTVAEHEAGMGRPPMSLEAMMEILGFDEAPEQWPGGPRGDAF
jgi:hypothetical protein